MERNIGICFDLDGVILNYKKRYYQTYKDILDDLNLPCLSLEELIELRRKTGLTQKELLNKHIIPLDFPERKRIIQEFCIKRTKLLEEEEYLKYDEYYDGALDFLRDLKKEEYPLGLITARKNKKTFLKQISDNIELFDFVRLERRKNLALEEFKNIFRKKENYFFTDSHQDIIYGNMVGFKTIGVTSGIDSKTQLLECLPNSTIIYLKEARRIFNI